MEKSIKQAVNITKNLYSVFCILPIIILILGENNDSWTGIYAADARMTFFLEAITILLTATCVPVSLKLYHRFLNKKINKIGIQQAIRLYLISYGIQLLLLSIPLIAGIMTYYLSLSNKMLLCSFIALTASLFCLPGEKRLRNELNITPNP